MKLNLGCGTDKRDGYVNVDREVDLNKFPYPWKDNTADEILLMGVLDFLDTPSAVIGECWRILKPNGKLVIGVPFFNSIAAIADVDDKHYFYEQSMEIFDGSKRVGFFPYKTPVKFKIRKTTCLKNPSFIFRFIPISFKNWVFNLCLGITWEMEAIK